MKTAHSDLGHTYAVPQGVKWESLRLFFCRWEFRSVSLCPLRAHSYHLAKTLLWMEAILIFSIDTVISLFCSFGNFYRDLRSTKWVSSNHLGAGV